MTSIESINLNISKPYSCTSCRAILSKSDKTSNGDLFKSFVNEGCGIVLVSKGLSSGE